MVVMFTCQGFCPLIKGETKNDSEPSAAMAVPSCFGDGEDRIGALGVHLGIRLEAAQVFSRGDAQKGKGIAAGGDGLIDGDRIPAFKGTGEVGHAGMFGGLPSG